MADDLAAIKLHVEQNVVTKDFLAETSKEKVDDPSARSIICNPPDDPGGSSHLARLREAGAVVLFQQATSLCVGTRVPGP